MMNLSTYRQLIEVRVAVQELEEHMQMAQKAFIFLRKQHDSLEKVIQEELERENREESDGQEARHNLQNM